MGKFAGISLVGWALLCSASLIFVGLSHFRGSVDLLDVSSKDMQSMLDVAEKLGAAKIESKRIFDSVRSLNVKNFLAQQNLNINGNVEKLRALESETSALQNAIKAAVGEESKLMVKKNGMNNRIPASSGHNLPAQKGKFICFWIF
jgi:hypothetical protein